MNLAHRGQPGPWRLADLMFLALISTAGLGALTVSWWAVRGRDDVADQVTWINVGVVGVLVMAAGNGMFLLTVRRAVGERRRRLLAAPPSAGGPSPGAGSTDVVASNGDAGRFVTATGMRRYHRADCQLVAGKTVETATEAAHRDAGRGPCGMCLP